VSVRVALIRGDGVGPELVDAALSVLRAIDVPIEFVPCEAGLEYWERHGGSSLIPDETWAVLEKSAACLKGPTTTPAEPGTPRSVAVSIRQRFNLYANVRPIRTLPGTPAPLGRVEFICVREATEDLYSGLEFRLSPDVAVAMRKITRSASERVARYAFRLAESKGWRKVIVITKANILKETDGLFLESVRAVAQEFPTIAWENYFIDNFAQQLIKNPQRFNQNILLSSNLFMDIISEEASGLVASIGMVPSGNYGDTYAMFEPAHGSAPKYKGQNRVNPTATILAGAMMLEYLGFQRHAQAIWLAVERVVAEGKHVTYDLGGSAGTREMAEAIAKNAVAILRSAPS
jgi:isocitrate dehydrogenase (NAD+)